MPGGKVQSKFIPKQTLNNPAGSQGSGAIQDVLLLITIVALASSLAVAAGMYIYSVYNQKNLKDAKNSLRIASQKFQELTIRDLKILGKQLEAGNTILRNHLAVSEVFRALEASTLKSVQYTKFTYSAKSPDEITLQLEGSALSVNALAWQSKILGAQKRIFKNPVFSNLDLKNGKASFNVDMQINPDAVKFENVIASKLQQQNTVNNSSDLPSGRINNTNTNNTDTSSTGTSSGENIFDPATTGSDLNSLDNALNSLDSSATSSGFGI